MAILLPVFAINANVPANDGDDPEEILIEQQNGEIPTSTHGVPIIHAYKTSTSVFVTISNYNGNLGVVINGVGGSVLSLHNPINGSSVVILNISELSSGNYTLSIYAQCLYQGIFSI